MLYVLVFMAHGRRQLVRVNVTANPTVAWVWRQLIEAAIFDIIYVATGTRDLATGSRTGSAGK